MNEPKDSVSVHQLYPNTGCTGIAHLLIEATKKRVASIVADQKHHGNDYHGSFEVAFININSGRSRHLAPTGRERAARRSAVRVEPVI